MKCSLCGGKSYGAFPVHEIGTFTQAEDGFGNFFVQELCWEHAYSLGHFGVMNNELHRRQHSFQDFMQQGKNEPLTRKEKADFDAAVKKTWQEELEIEVARQHGLLREVCHCGDTLADHHMYSGHTFTPIPRHRFEMEYLAQFPDDLDHTPTFPFPEDGPALSGVLTETSELFERLGETCQTTGEAIVTAMQDLLELTPEELREATAYEDIIEVELDKHVGEDIVEVILFRPDSLERIRDYLFDRFKGWTVKCKDGDPVWEFHAR